MLTYSLPTDYVYLLTTPRLRLLTEPDVCGCACACGCDFRFDSVFAHRMIMTHEECLFNCLRRPNRARIVITTATIRGNYC